MKGINPASGGDYPIHSEGGLVRASWCAEAKAMYHTVIQRKLEKG